MREKLFFIFACLFLSSTVNAQIFKCVNEQGKKIFQSVPCNDIPSQQVEIHDQSTTGMAEWSSRPIERPQSTEKMTTANERTPSDFQLEQALKKEINVAMTLGELVIGMTQDEVRKAWGFPCYKGRFNGVHTQWKYCRNKDTWRDDVFVYFDPDGKYMGKNGEGQRAEKRYKGNKWDHRQTN